MFLHREGLGLLFDLGTVTPGGMPAVDRFERSHQYQGQLSVLQRGRRYQDSGVRAGASARHGTSCTRGVYDTGSGQGDLCFKH